ncbi:MAG: arginine--tRNA ligase [Candidatus Gastranaerophilales bacterium]|nr:arginine--tRNA ligase [Candidatus Gastranaerophilales bacterium]
MMIKDFFVNVVKNAADEAVLNKKLGAAEKITASFVCETPKNPEFGDFSVNVSSLARDAKMAPPMIANAVKEFIKPEDFSVNTVAGFINFKLEEGFLKKVVKEILAEKENYGRMDLGKGKKINIEYVSANPTGPFHIGHGRWAALGSSLAEVLKFTGYDVYQEFYINDAGNQINKLAMSLELRVKELKGETVEWPEDAYRGDYLIDCAKRYVEQNSNEPYGEFAKKDMLRLQKELLEKFETHFDCFFSETALYKNNEVEKCVKALETAGKLYEKDGALWFRTTDYTDDQDRVLRKQDGSNTYLTADIAYHKNKFDRGFDHLINIWGADHHGYIPRMKAAVDALGYDSSNLEVLLGQLVNIIQNGEAVRMGKRKKMVTLDELVDEVGVDATRFWMLMRSIDTTLDFDVDLAKQKNDQNPVFYVQYAHARSCSILRKAVEDRLDTETGEKLPPFIEKEELDEILNNISDDLKLPELFDKADEKSYDATRKLILRLEEFKTTVEGASRMRAPYLLCKYASNLAYDFHHFYNFTRVLSDDKELTKGRLALVAAVKNVLGEVFKLLKITAPEKM